MVVNLTRSNSDPYRVTQPALLAGQSLRVPLEIVGFSSSKSAVVTVTYAQFPHSSVHRSFKEKVSWEVRPSLELKSLRALPAHNNAPCRLLLEIQNSAATSFALWSELEGKKTSEYTAAIGQNRTMRVTLPLACVDYGPGSNQLRRAVQSAAQLDQLFTRCRSEFFQRVKLKWTSADDRRGVLPVAEALVTRELLSTLLPPPFTFTCSLPPECLLQDPGTLREEPRYHTLLGQFQKLNIAVTNTTLEPQAVDLTVLPYQDLNGRLDVELGQKLLIVGSLSPSWPIVFPGQTIMYDVNLCFLSPGRFGCQFSVQYHQVTEQEAMSKGPDPKQRLSHPKGKREEERLSFTAPSPLIVDAVVVCE